MHYPHVPFLFLFIFMIAMPAFAATDVWKSCPGFRGIEVDAQDPTARYLRLLQFYGAQKSVIGESDLIHLMESPEPRNPFEGRDDLSATTKHVYERTFAEVLAQGGIDWPRVREAVARLLGHTRDQAARRANASTETQWLIAAKPVPNTDFAMSLSASIVAARFWSGGRAAVGGANRYHDPTGWSYRESPGDKFHFIGAGQITHVMPRTGESSLVVLLSGDPERRPDSVKIFDGRTGAEIHSRKFEGPWPVVHSEATSFLFEPAPGKRAVLSSWTSKDGTHGEWQIIPGGAVQHLPTFPGPVRFAVSADAKKAYAYGIVGNEARVYDATTGSVVHTLPYDGSRASVGETFMHCNAKGELFMAASFAGTLEVYDFARGKHFAVPLALGIVASNPPFVEAASGKVSFGFVVNRESVGVVDLGTGRVASEKLPEPISDSANRPTLMQFPNDRPVIISSQYHGLQIVDVEAHHVTKAPRGEYVGYLETPDGRVIALKNEEKVFPGANRSFPTIPLHHLTATQLLGPR